MRKKREILTSPAGPGIPDAERGVPSVRGADSAPSVTDLPGVSGLPGMRSDNPDGKPQEVSPSPPPVAKRTVKDLRNFANLDLEEKIGVLNALKKIKNKYPNITDPAIRPVIKELYTAWVDEMMLKILQPGGSVAAGFTQEESQALKILAQTILQRQQGSAGQPQAPAPAIPRQGAAPKPIGGLDPGVDSVKLQQAQRAFLTELQKMEREGPSF